MKSNLLFIILVLGVAVSKESKLNCLLERLERLGDLPNQALANLQAHLREADLNSKVVVDRTNFHELLGLRDFSSGLDARRLVLGHSSLPESVRAAMSACQLSIDGLLKKCQDKFHGDCEKFDEFTVVRKCPEGSLSAGPAHCVPVCPDGLTSSEENPYICLKTTQISRSAQLKTKTKYRGTQEVGICPEGFRTLEADVCIKECPQGWEDFGAACSKPIAAKRDHEVFYYKFEEDI